MLSCPVFIIKAKLADHESQCEFRKEPCEYCGELVVYNECGVTITLSSILAVFYMYFYVVQVNLPSHVHRLVRSNLLIEMC